MTLVDTGERHMTGGRLKRVATTSRTKPIFALTYGDGVADIDIDAAIAFHQGARRRQR